MSGALEQSGGAEPRKRVAAETVGGAEYARLRLVPRPGHNFYLHLRDLRIALEGVASLAKGKLLDYGCGSSPYRSLFADVEYIRADYTPAVDLDYLVREDQTIDVPRESFDSILSTQVLEHVRQPELYLRECFRLLKPGGVLLLSTHGTFEEHGCPYDFRRWTADGLTFDVTSVGFRVERVLKLTTGPRAAAFLLRQYGGMLAPGRRSLAGILHWFLFRRTESYFAKIDRRLDRLHSDCMVVDAGEAGRPLYIALLAVAIKPS